MNSEKLLNLKSNLKKVEALLVKTGASVLQRRNGPAWEGGLIIRQFGYSRPSQLVWRSFSSEGIEYMYYI